MSDVIIYINNTIGYNTIYPNNYHIQNMLIKTLNLEQWNYGHLTANRIQKPFLTGQNKNWYFISLPDGTQITCKNIPKQLLKLL